MITSYHITYRLMPLILRWVAKGRNRGGRRRRRRSLVGIAFLPSQE